MENQTNYHHEIEIKISTHLSTFEPEFRIFLSTPRLSQKKGVLIKKKVCIVRVRIEEKTQLFSIEKP